MTPTEKLDKVFESALSTATGFGDTDPKSTAALLKVALDAACASADLETTKRMQQELTDALANVDPEVSANLAAVLDEHKKRRALVKAVA